MKRLAMLWGLGAAVRIRSCLSPIEKSKFLTDRNVAGDAV